MRKDLLAGLDDDQRQAVTAPNGPVCVLAGAGTGKTRTITRRIAHLVTTGEQSASEILAVTFTNRAAGEMRVRLRALGVPTVQARTFHAAALRQLRYFWPTSVGGPMWPVLDKKLRFVAEAARTVRVSTELAMLRDLASEIEWSKASLVAPERYAAVAAAAHRDPPVDLSVMADVFAAYGQACTRAGVLDFDDLLVQTVAALEKEDIAREFRRRYRSFVVDEYQDVTPLQQCVLDSWLGHRDRLTVVGDANQTIYSFAGASPTPLLTFADRYPEATVVKLTRDYRSTPQVVATANRIIAGATGKSAKLRLRLESAQAPGPEVLFRDFDDEATEARTIAHDVAALIDAGAVAAAEIAVLFRMNAQSEIYEKAMADAKVPYVIRGGERFFERPEIRQAMIVLRRAARDEPVGKLVTIVKSALVTVGLEDEPPQAGALRDRWEALQSLVSLAEDLVADQPEAGLSHLVAELEQRADAQHSPTVQGVTLASLHSAKGLEWEAVFLVGLTEGMLPIHYADQPDEIEEERRLLYVGVTRARTRLTLSWAQARNEGGRRRERSRFLNGLGPRPRVSTIGHRSTAPCRLCGETLTGTSELTLGRCQNCAGDVDVELHDRLIAWRLEQAADHGVPFYAVFTDDLLLAIAEQRPASHAALVAIDGVLRSKVDKYGDSLVEVVRTHLDAAK